MQLLCRQQREAVSKIESHLIAEHAASAGAGAIAPQRTGGHYMVK